MGGGGLCCLLAGVEGARQILHGFTPEEGKMKVKLEVEEEMTDKEVEEY